MTKEVMTKDAATLRQLAELYIERGWPSSAVQMAHAYLEAQNEVDRLRLALDRLRLALLDVSVWCSSTVARVVGETAELLRKGRSTT